MPFIIPVPLILIGLLVFVALIRQEYDEQIEITNLQVNYKRKGRLRKPINWDEPLRNYAGIIKSSEDAVEDARILTIVLKHKSKTHLNVVLDRKSENEIEQRNKQKYFSELIKIPCLN